MRSKVYFIAVNDGDSQDATGDRLTELLAQSGLLDAIPGGSKVCLKMHFGEEGNTGYVRPYFVKIISDRIKDKGSFCFLSDTNTLYHGRRKNPEDHLRLAYEHGFTPEKAGAPVFIADDRNKEDVAEPAIDGEFVKKASILRVYLEAGVILGLAHFKGHIMTGFGGALKNIGMGCASRKGKLNQHCDVSPYVISAKCSGCGECQIVCPVGAISLMHGKSFLDEERCIGCASCVACCQSGAIDVKWESGESRIQERMVEYASAVLTSVKKKALFINFLTRITKECDCLAKDDPRISPDVGILASSDPVSIDQASIDLIKQACGRDIFKEAHPNRDGSKQLLHASKLGLGNLEYELIKLS